ncbi:MAG: SDR family NAD(P)-dependent oxidoreductase, partial [Acidimicrobiales bacterium]
GRGEAALLEVARRTGGRAVVADLAEPGDVGRLAREAEACDILVANAALPASGRLESYDAAGVDRALDVNLRAPIQLARAAVPAMVARRHGHVLLVSSLSGLAASPESSLYAATKFGLRGFGLALRQDLAGTGVGVSVLLPGFISEAGMFADSGAKLPPGVGTRTPAEVAEAAVRAIERDVAEAAVAPLPVTAGAYVATLLPGPAGRVQRRLGARTAARLAAGQLDKR